MTSKGPFQPKALYDSMKTAYCFSYEEQTLNLSFSTLFDGTRVVKSRKIIKSCFRGQLVFRDKKGFILFCFLTKSK